MGTRGSPTSVSCYSRASARCSSTWSTTTRRDLPTEQGSQLVAGADIGRVCDADEQAVGVQHADRDRAAVASLRRGEALGCGRLDLGRIEVDELQVVLFRQRPGDGRRVDPAPLDEQLAEPEARPLLVDQCELQLLVRDQSFAHEQGTERKPGRLVCWKHHLLYRPDGLRPKPPTAEGCRPVLRGR